MKHVLTVIIRFSIEYSSRPEGDLQPYEELMYKQACDFSRQYLRLNEIMVKKAIETELTGTTPEYTDESGDGGTTTVKT